MSTDLEISSAQVSQRRKVENAMDKIVDHGIVIGETLYRVRWSGYNAKDATAKPAVHLSDDYIESYCRRLSRPRRPYR